MLHHNLLVEHRLHDMNIMQTQRLYLCTVLRHGARSKQRSSSPRRSTANSMKAARLAAEKLQQEALARQKAQQQKLQQALARHSSEGTGLGAAGGSSMGGIPGVSELLPDIICLLSAARAVMIVVYGYHDSRSIPSTHVSGPQSPSRCEHSARTAPCTTHSLYDPLQAPTMW
jgi:hypothetical protein